MTVFRIVRLSECVDLLAGFAFKSQGFTGDPDDIPLVKGENVSQGCILWDASKRWPAVDWEALRKYQLRSGDVVLAMDRPWVPAGLKWAFIKESDPKSLLVQRCARLRSKIPDLDQRFLRFIIGSPAFEAYVRPITSGVNVPHISGGQILDYSFPLPPLPFQRRIADILSAYDDLIANCQRRIEILEQMACALYREWFVKFRYPGHESVPLVSSPLGEIPRGWMMRPIKEVSSVTYGFPFASRLFNTNGDGIPLVRIRDIPVGQSATYTTEPADPKYRLENGDTLVGMDGDFHMCVWAGGLAVLNQRVARFRSAGEIGRFHLFLALESPIQALNGSIVGTTVAHLGDAHIQKICILWPPAGLRALADEVLEPMVDRVMSLKCQVRLLRRTRDLLLPRLISGQLEVDAA